MTNDDSLASSHSDLNRFLFSEVGVDASGRMLSVLSALARQDLDPWQEAGSLAKLPKPSATARLAHLIAMPASLLPLADASVIAAKLVTLLPPRGDTTESSVMPIPRGAIQWLMLVLAVAAAVLVAITSHLIG